MKVALLGLLCIALANGDAPEKRLLFSVNAGVDLGSISDSRIVEASGLCASRKHAGVLFTHNDYDHKSGENIVYALNATTAQQIPVVGFDDPEKEAFRKHCDQQCSHVTMVIAAITITGSQNNDWEDIACGPCFGHTNDWCMYIGDIGHAAGNAAVNIIYMVEEPDTFSATMQEPVSKKLTFSWGEEDAETLLVDHLANVYVISKKPQGAGLVAEIPSQGWTQSSPVTLTNTAAMTYSNSSERDPEGGDISPDGQEILIKYRNEVLHFNVQGATDLVQVLTGTPFIMPYTVERKGQSICFSKDGKSYYTLGEGVHEHLWRYDGAAV